MGNYVVRNRYVVSYIPEGERWPTGILTGHDNGRRCFVVEWVVSFDPLRLTELLRAGIAEAIRHGFGAIAFNIPHEFPTSKALRRVSENLGFRETEKDDFQSYFFRTVP